jgi:CRISPR-associated endonuclease/helicase Cas3
MTNCQTYLSFWGKVGDVSDDNDWHPAALHMLDVAAVARAYLEEARPHVPGLQPPGPEPWPTIAFLVAVHDIGKFSRAFQQKVERRWPACLEPFSALNPLPRHDSAGFWMLTERFSGVLTYILPGLERSEVRQIFRAVCGHHGRPPSDKKSGQERQAICETCLYNAGQFLDDLLRLLDPQPLGLADAQAFSWWLAGLTVLADWVGSNKNWFGYEPCCTDLAAYWLRARRRAAIAVREAGVLPAPHCVGLNIAELLPPGAMPSPMQRLAATLGLGGRDMPTLVIIEDQTGSGKTEAALLLANRLMNEKAARGVFLALPTMATANALYTRLGQLYRHLFAPECEPSLVLAHGRRRLHEGFMASVEHIVSDALARGDAADETASAQCAGWIAADRRRSFLADCGVGTIDQALHAVLPTRHAPLRLFGLRDRVLIIDEAHAYDIYMQEELFRLIEFQRKLGGCAIILSATLPRAMRCKLVKAFGARVDRQIDAYPLVTIACGAGVTQIACAPNETLKREIAVTRLPDAAAAVPVIVAAAARGGAVCWIRNTVDDAISAQGQLRAAGIDAMLFHARFAMGDRQVIETEVQRRVGKASTGAQRHVVIIGTQVMEQSLDIDFDMMVSDLAPVDLLLQRAGRLWRHERSPRPMAAPALFVIAPEPVADPPKDWLAAMPGTAAVYRHPALLWRSAGAIFAKPVMLLPDDVRGMVEAVYGDDAPTPAHLLEKSDAVEGAEKSAASIAWMNLMTWEAGYSSANGAWESDVKTPIRLSDPSRSFRLAVLSANGLCPWYDDTDPQMAWALSEVSIPLRLAKDAPESPDVAALRNGWSKFDQDISVLVLRMAGDDWAAVGVGANDKPVTLRYSKIRGLEAAAKPGMGARE